MKEKIYYFQEKSNDILDLQDDFTAEEIGMLFILKAAYFKYSGELREENLCQRCKFFGDKEKLILLTKKIFCLVDGVLTNQKWLEEISEIKERSEKRANAANTRWSKTKKPKITQLEPKETQRAIQNEQRSEFEKDFEEFWESYMPIVTNDGKKVDKGSKKLAKISYGKARKDYDAETIYNGTAQYLADCYRNNRLSCQVSVCLNQERFLNDFNAPTLQVKTTEKHV